MGGNGARSAFMANSLDSYTGVRFNDVGKIGGIKIIQPSNQSNTAIPMESFSATIYYVANPKNGRIEHIAFYDKNGNIKHSIDLDFNEDGSPKPYREFRHRGKLRSEGCHFHRNWQINNNGDKGRIRHNSSIEAVNRYYMRFVNHATEYNNLLNDHEK